MYVNIVIPFCDVI